MRPAERKFFGALGAHIVELRKAHGMTQTELARAIDIRQQSLFAYENAKARISVLVLAKVAKTLRSSTDALIWMVKPAHAPKRRLSPRAARHGERLQALSPTQQRFVLRIIDTLEASNNAKKPLVTPLDVMGLGPRASTNS